MRSLRSLIGLTCVTLLILALAACSDDSNGTTDTGPKEAGVDMPAPPTKIECSGDCFDYVLNSLTFPDSSSANKIGWDYDGDGIIDNALGGILGAIGGVAPGMDIQESIDGALYEGKTIVLMRLQADSAASDPEAAAQAWVGGEQKCCSDPTDANACMSEAKAGCFAGGHTFWPSVDSPKDALFGGKISSGGKALFGPSSMKLIIPITGAGILDMNLKSVYIKGTLSSDGKRISDGILAGAVTKSELDTSLIPTIVGMLNTTLQDPNGSQTAKDGIIQIFDTDPTDGTISEKEVKENSFIKMFLEGDVDATGDGNKDLSLGVAFTAIEAKIVDQAPPMEAGVDAGVDVGVDAGVDAASDALPGQ